MEVGQNMSNRCTSDSLKSTSSRSLSKRTPTCKATFSDVAPVPKHCCPRDVGDVVGKGGSLKFQPAMGFQ